MVSQKTSKTNKYNATFPTILRKLMSKHPIGGRPTTQKELARELDIRPQTVSLYVNGITQPSPDTLVNIANYFNVSIDYLLTGVSSFNKETNTSLGLTETSINWTIDVLVKNLIAERRALRSGDMTTHENN